MNNFRAKQLFEKAPGHDLHRHKGKAFSQTGYVRGCLRCIRLKRVRSKPEREKDD